jgi:hypothetical protein
MKFGSNGNENPNYGRKAVGFFSLKILSLTRSWPLDWRGCFEQGIKWHAPLGLDFGLDLWRLHTSVWPSKLRGRGSSWPKIWTLGLTFGGFTLRVAKSFTYYILLAIFSLFLWTLNKV